MSSALGRGSEHPKPTVKEELQPGCEVLEPVKASKAAGQL